MRFYIISMQHSTHPQQVIIPQKASNQKKMLIIGVFFILLGGILFSGKFLLQRITGNPAIDSTSQIAQAEPKWESEQVRTGSLSGIDDQEVLAFSIALENEILAEASNLGLISLPDDFVARTGKIPESYFQQKQQLLSTVEQEYKKREAKMSGSIIGVFFYNQKMPEIPFDQADAQALKLLENARKMVLSQTWTPQEAMTELKNDPIIPKLDFNYAFNTGTTFNAISVSDFTQDPVMIEAIRSLPKETKTQVSNIYRSPGSADEYNRAYFTNKPELNGMYFFLVLTENTDGFYQSYDRWKSGLTQRIEAPE